MHSGEGALLGAPCPWPLAGAHCSSSPERGTAQAGRLLFPLHGPGKPSARVLGELVFKAMDESGVTLPMWE